MAGEMKVWIDQDLCTGDGLCEEILPDIFTVHDDGLAYVKEQAWRNILGPDGTSVDNEPAVRHGQRKTTNPDFVPLPAALLNAALEAADECPGECIFVEPAD